MRILVVDDDRAVRESLRRSLAFNGYQVDLAVDGKDALDAVQQRRPDAMVLDVMMPRLDGLEVCRRMREAGDELPILVLTARDAVSDRVAGPRRGRRRLPAQAVRAGGAAGPAPRAAAPPHRRRHRRARRGRRVLQFADLSLDPDTREVRRGERPISLTRTEFSLLELLLAHPRRVLTRAQILEQVWGYDFPTTGNALEVYIGYLRRKTEADGEPRLIHTVRGVGYVLRESPP